MAQHDVSGRHRWHVFAGAEQVAAALSAEIARHAEDALRTRATYSIVLPGGSTPRLLFALLRDLGTDWSRWHVYFTDERCVPRDAPERNDAVARTAWLDQVAMPRAHIHSIPAEKGADAGAADCDRALTAVGQFDTTLLGLGEDGHTASLFPGHELGDSAGAPNALPVHGAPKPPAERVSLSAARLAAAHHVLMLATGGDKRAAVAQLRRGDPIPAAAIRPADGVDVWLDAAAAADIRSSM